MIIKDRVYGKIEIKDKVIVDLINSKPIQRLKKISQDGASHFIQPVRDVTRYEHSIGVWYLSYKFKRPLEEQIASLLHDIPHTAFSHVIDVVVNDEKHEFHDEFTEEIILNSEIPVILAEHKIDIKKVLKKENFDLLENELPDISVDRWDYFMRDGVAIGFMPKVLVNEFLDHVKVRDSKFYFKDVSLAATFAVLFVNFSRLLWLDPTSHGSYNVLANAIKRGVETGVITEKDFFTDDIVLMDKLKSANSNDINGLLSRLQPGNEFIFVDEDKAEFYGPNKPRFVDPLVLQKGKLVRVSKLVPSLGYFFEEFENRYKMMGVKPV